MRSQLTNADEETIGGWPLTKTLRIDGAGEVLFCHATPRNDTEVFTAATSDEKLRAIFDPLGVNVVICGHVHMQFDRKGGRHTYRECRQRRNAVRHTRRLLVDA